MKKLFIIFLILILSLTLFVACDKSDNNSETEAVVMKPFAFPDPNNPYDQKIIREYTEADIGRADWIYIVLTQSESFNNIFYEYKLTDFFEEEFVNTFPEGSSMFNANPDLEHIIRKLINCDENVENPYKDLSIETYTRVLKIELGWFVSNNSYDYAQEVQLNLEIVRRLNQKDYVKQAYPYPYSGWFTYTPSGYSASAHWGLERISSREAWDYVYSASSVKVGIIDSGIDSGHNNLSNSINHSLSALFNSTYGIDTIGHGTEVSGIIASDGVSGNSNLQAFGVTGGVNIVILKAVTSTGQESVDLLIDAIEFAEEHDIKILNYCSGFKRSAMTDTQYNNLQSAINQYSGILIVAAGNVNYYSNDDDLIR